MKIRGHQTKLILLNIVNCLPALIILVLPYIVFGAADGLTTFQGQLQGSASKIYGYAKITLSVGLLLYTIWPFYHALIGEGDKTRYWWQIIGIAVFLILLNIFPIVFNSLFNQNITITE
jgi:hypothetical protein